MSRIIGDDELDSYKDNYEEIVKSENAEKERMMKASFEQALVVRSMKSADLARTSLVAEQAAMKPRLDQVTVVSLLHLEAGLTDADIALQHAVDLMASEYGEELKRVVYTQRGVFREHDAIRDE